MFFSGIGFGGEERVESDDKIQEYIKDGSMSVQELSLAAQIEGKKSGISAVKATNRAIIRYIVHRIQLGAIFSLPQALEMLRFLHPPSVLQRTIFRGLFEIAPGLSIPVYTYKKCHRVNIPTLKKVVTSGDIDRAGEKEEEEEKKKRLPVAERKVVYRLQNDLTIEVEADRTIKGFKYGRSLIPESSIDAEAMKPRTERCLVLIGFTEAYKVQRQSFMGESDVVMAAPSDPCAYSALSAFVAAMAELDRYAICRYISRKSAQPALVALIPRKKKRWQQFSPQLFNRF